MIQYIVGKEAPKEEWEKIKNKETSRLFSQRACFASLEGEIYPEANLYLIIPTEEHIKPLFESFVEFYPNITIIDSFKQEGTSWGGTGKKLPDTWPHFVEITSTIENLEHRFYYLLYMGILCRLFSEMKFLGADADSKKATIEKLNFFEYIQILHEEGKNLNSNHLLSDWQINVPKELLDLLLDQEEFCSFLENGRKKHPDLYKVNYRTFPLRQTSITKILLEQLPEWKNKAEKPIEKVKVVEPAPVVKPVEEKPAIVPEEKPAPKIKAKRNRVLKRLPDRTYLRCKEPETWTPYKRLALKLTFKGANILRERYKEDGLRFIIIRVEE